MAAISTVRLWETLGETTKTSTAGYQTESSFNHNIKDVNISLFNTLAPYYSVNQYVKDLLAPFVIRQAPTDTDANGVLTKPTDYFRYIDSSIGGYPVYPIAINEVAITNQSPIRKPSKDKNLYFSYQEDNDIKYLPEEELEVSLSYFKIPQTPEIELTPVSIADRDYLIPTAVTEFEWEDNAFDFILYMMLEKYGLEMKEQLYLQFANIGIQREASKI